VLVNLLLPAMLCASPVDECTWLLDALPHSRLDAEIGRVIMTCGRHVQTFMAEQFLDHSIATTPSCKWTRVENCCKACHPTTCWSSRPDTSVRIGVLPA
jgi:hypothetical protein